MLVPAMLAGQLSFALAPCKEHFPASAFRDPDSAKLIEQIKTDRVPNQELAQKLAARGAQAVPYIAELACESKRQFYFKDMKAGIFGSYTDFPFVRHAAAVLALISDPAALESLKTLSFYPRIGGSAQEAITRITRSTDTSKPTETSPVGSDFVKKIIDNDARTYKVRYKIDQYLQLAANLSPADREDVIAYLLDGRRVTTFNSFDSGSNIHNLQAIDLQAWEKIVRAAGAERSPAILAILKGQRAGLSRSLQTTRATAENAEQMNFFSDVGRQHVRQDIERTERMIAVYDDVLAHSN